MSVIIGPVYNDITLRPIIFEALLSDYIITNDNISTRLRFPLFYCLPTYQFASVFYSIDTDESSIDTYEAILKS